MYTEDIGGISWVDLTAKNAENVIGLKSALLRSMITITLPTNMDNQVGICHAKGSNSGLAAQ